jgi:hypothetical protein
METYARHGGVTAVKMHVDEDEDGTGPYGQMRRRWDHGKGRRLPEFGAVSPVKNAAENTFLLTSS